MLSGSVRAPTADCAFRLPQAGHDLQDGIDGPRGVALSNLAWNQSLSLVCKLTALTESKEFVVKGKKHKGGRGMGTECVCSCRPSDFNSINKTEFQLPRKRAFDDILTQPELQQSKRQCCNYKDYI